MNRKKGILIWWVSMLALISLVLSGCSNSAAQANATATSQAMQDMHMQETQTAMQDMGMQGTEPAASMMHNELTLHINGLPDLGNGWAYEGWLIVDDSPVSTGIFTVDDAMMMSAETFPVDPDMLSKATTFILTIEPSPDSDPAPSPVHILAGDLNGDIAGLSVAHSDALGNDFTSASGEYVLAAPTAGTGGDFRDGIWFLDPMSGSSASLSLPDLSEGWVYEGWVVPVDASMAPVSLGRFTAADMADSDGAGSTAGPNAAPPFPGQDFINPAMNLVGYGVVITIEPEPDTSPAPFGLKPLAAGAIQDLSGEALQPLENQAVGFPTGTATR
jgi:hypothetical protein